MRPEDIATNSDAQALLDFWFKEHDGKDWFGGKAEFDAEVSSRFMLTLKKAERCELFEWRDTPQGRLAEIIALDQFSRQLYRGHADAFKNDSLALALAQETISQGLDMKLNEKEQQFLYMPYMHAESLAIQNEGLNLFRKLSDDLYEFQLNHTKVIERFGRFPKRNAALGRASTPDEVAYMNERGDSMF
ncbi:DUF924 family protein [Ahrensia kielensis]|uniref:DUF924 family protein n=1 Tax=Ahrensia kielensis TaxID=76980 RepID=A0ABU9T6K5_9HYPH|nr:DUF924 family protein [Ahrensia kielensis]